MAVPYALTKNHLSNLRCNKCKKFLTVAPIHLNNGKYFCGRCSVSGERVTIYEELAGFMSFPCTNELCPDQLKWDKVEKHESICQYKLMECPKPNCKACYKINDVYKHFEAFHYNTIYAQELRAKRALRVMPFKKFNTDRSVYLLYSEYQIYVVMVYGSCKPDINKPKDIGSYSYSFGVFYLNKNAETKTHYDLTVIITDGKNIDTTYSWKNQELEEYINENCLGCLDKNCCKGHTNETKTFLCNRINSLQNNGGNYVINYIVKLVNNTRNYQLNLSRENSSLAAKLECPVCNEYLCVPIYICSNGHSLCSQCNLKLKTCPLCQGIIGKSRNFSLEKISETLEICCPNAIKGCPYMGKVRDTKQHTLVSCQFIAGKI